MSSQKKKKKLKHTSYSVRRWHKCSYVRKICNMLSKIKQKLRWVELEHNPMRFFKEKFH